MNYFELGNTGLRVSELCFGALPLGPLQANLSIEEGGSLILQALQQGVNFIDSAEIYGTHQHIKWALDRYQGEVVLATKSPALTYEQMQQSVAKCLEELGVDSIAIFHLHAARDSKPLQNRAEVLEALVELKAAGLIKNIGVSTHSVTAVREAAQDPRVDVVFPLVNKRGLGILDGSLDEMIAAISLARCNGKGVYAMKAFGGGTMIDDLEGNLKFVREAAGIPVVAVGMIRDVELEMNLKLFEGAPISAELRTKAGGYRKVAKVIVGLCKGCGRCLQGCHSGAIRMVDGKGFIDVNQCLMCGYCSRECPEFAIRVI